jgi:hypothetical protein
MGVRSPAFLIGGDRLTDDDAQFAHALAAAHADRRRPRCLCRPEGVEMYIARLGNGHIVKRMPYTGCQHAPDCPAFEPAAELSGLGQLLGTAIHENPRTGQTLLRFGFSLSKLGSRHSTPDAASTGPSVTDAEGAKLSLLGLLHYLWDQAELTRWHPGFSGRRSWGTVRKQLLIATEGKIARGVALSSRLYVPEVFSVEEREAINARRIASWSAVTAGSGPTKRLMLLIAELKEIGPSHFGHKAVIKHMPDQALAIDSQLYARITRCFEDQLALWSSWESIRMITAATFEVSEAGLPAIAQMALMPVTAQWLPVEDTFEHQLLGKLVREQRCFARCLRYNMPAGSRLPMAVLLDLGREPLGLWIARRWPDESQVTEPSQGVAAWHWSAAKEAIPPLPSAPLRDSEPPKAQPPRDNDARVPGARETIWPTAPACMLPLTVRRPW